MKFYYENSFGNDGYFLTKNTEVTKAIMSAWNIGASLYLVEKIDNSTVYTPIFYPLESNEENNYYLRKYGYKIVGEMNNRELRYIRDNSLVTQEDDWHELIDLK